MSTALEKRKTVFIYRVEENNVRKRKKNVTTNHSTNVGLRKRPRAIDLFVKFGRSKTPKKVTTPQLDAEVKVSASV